ncbi:hypothetical protein C7H19_19435 [Aphanothece hegewaldii CCALA 016]|uniref:KilA-N domain-containing protein n=1 Tax=Aphanothece hegewaldii CCALA 016 TaxID=2107694 RepID=A0A2T1LTF5_9CHRO|nr:KilA-N domain-containing protein [Aphanothece hegewaldii]PSF33898.1 hypothetical protein C7H19_19435 [Aphanothece hegewaldii CCALA 016]
MSIIIHETNGLEIDQRREDGYINLTQMAQANGKKLNDYLRLETTKTFLEELCKVTGIPVSKLIQIRKGKPANLQGTWGHPQIAIHCGQWCSAKFAVLVSGWVVTWMMTAQNPIQHTQPKFEAQETIKAYTEGIQALNRVIHTAIHQQTNLIRDSLELVNNDIPPITFTASRKSENINEPQIAIDIQPLKDDMTAPTESPKSVRSRRQQGYGSGYIYWRTYKGKYHQAFYHYELWRNSERHVKSSRYIPKKLVSEVQRLDEEKAPVMEILKLLDTD